MVVKRVPPEKRAAHRKEKVHKRVYITKRTDIMLQVMNSLMNNDVYDEFIEACLLYGMGYLNDKNKVNLVKWTGQLSLPSLKDVDQLLKMEDV